MRYLYLLIGEPDIEAPVPGTPEFVQMLRDFESATRAMAAGGVLARRTRALSVKGGRSGQRGGGHRGAGSWSRWRSR
jgi:hypothetical protein